ncbi:MAG: M20/M25/M40 family metallo-hydrolase [Gemmatimonadota bacterium]|nr:MAG: M20/M25/M40 family metallo-hydrolase [Gemmatimonadota bacterium]
MNGSNRLLALALALAATACSPRAPEESAAPRRAAPAINVGDLEGHLTALAHDSMMGRESGTLGHYMATEYIATQVARLGLEPAGDDGYFQTIPLVQRGLDPEASVSVGATALEVGTDYLPVPSTRGFLSFGMTGSLAGVETIYAGRASDPSPSLTPDQVAGKLVVLDLPVGPRGEPSFDAWNRSALRAYESATGVAIAVLDILPPQLARFLSQPRTMLGGGELPEGPLAMLITRETAARLMGGSIESASIGDHGATIEGTFRFVDTPAPYPTRNVVGIVRGSDPSLRDQYVAIGAHTDHVGIRSQAIDHDSIWAFNHVVRPMGAESPPRQATPAEEARIRAIRDSLRTVRAPRADSTYNGADDDGSGSVAMLAIAEAFARDPEKPRRSIIFVWHTAEENGLYGARWFTNNPTVPRDSIVAQLDLDMVGRGSDGDIEGGGPAYLQLIGSRRLSTELGDIVEEVNEQSGLGFRFDYQFDAPAHPQQYYCRSDHYMYARYGIPVVLFSTGSHLDYHQVTDESQYIDYEKLRDVSRLVYEIARTVADLDHRLVVDKPKPDPNARCRQ